MKRIANMRVSTLVAILLAITTAVFGALYIFERVTKAVPAVAQTQQPAAPQLRVYDGNVQWFDGASWHNETSIDALASSDPFLSAAENEPTDAVLTVPEHGRAGGTVVTKTTTPAKKPTTTTPGTGGGTTTTPTPTPTPPPSTGGGTGDGEDIDWSGDHL